MCVHHHTTTTSMLLLLVTLQQQMGLLAGNWLLQTISVSLFLFHFFSTRESGYSYFIYNYIYIYLVQIGFLELEIILEKMIHIVVIMMLSLVASLLFLYGWYGHNTILGSNQCKMTYSQPKKSPVHVKGYMGNYKLWKLSNSDSKKLNKHPIVFIPGHLGRLVAYNLHWFLFCSCDCLFLYPIDIDAYSVDQSRSFASYMHNDDNLFQYFALDFNDEAIALHGADILTKADFLNKAIEAIVSLYDQNSNSKG